MPTYSIRYKIIDSNKQPVKARTKEQAKSKVLGGDARFMKKITVSVMR